jgi:hypothetical protein
MSFNSQAFEEKLTSAYSLVSGHYDQAVVTGSAAIVWLVLHHPDLAPSAQQHLESLGYDCETGPNDVDIISVQNTDIHEKRIGDFVSVQGPTSSKTFSSGHESFDIIKSGSCSYIELNGVNIIHPNNLIAHYEENYRESDELKLSFLLENEHLFGMPVKSFSAKAKQRRASQSIDDSCSQLDFSRPGAFRSPSKDCGCNRQLSFAVDDEAQESVSRRLFG